VVCLSRAVSRAFFQTVFFSLLNLRWLKLATVRDIPSDSASPFLGVEQFQTNYFAVAFRPVPPAFLAAGLFHIPPPLSPKTGPFPISSPLLPLRHLRRTDVPSPLEPDDPLPGSTETSSSSCFGTFSLGGSGLWLSLTLLRRFPLHLQSASTAGAFTPLFPPKFPLPVRFPPKPPFPAPDLFLPWGFPGPKRRGITLCRSAFFLPFRRCWSISAVCDALVVSPRYELLPSNWL